LLAPPDEELVRRERMLPGLATVLDPDAFVAALRPLVPDAELREARSVSARFASGERCLALYRVGLGDRSIDVHAIACRPERLAALAGAGSALAEHAIVVSIFPQDRKLRALARFDGGTAQERLVRRLLPEHAALHAAPATMLSYKPERRWVAMLHAADGTRAELKLYVGRDYARASACAAALRPSGALRLAQPIGACERDAALAFAWAPGRPLRDALASGAGARRAAELAGAALAALHAQDPAALPVRSRGEEAGALGAAANAVAALAPGLGARARRLAERLAARLVREPRGARPVHGDFYAKQVLVQPEHAVLLDLDQAACGDPAADLGLFAAHLERDPLRGLLLAELAAPALAALLDGYAAIAAPPTADRLALYTAVGLLRLAPQHFRSREPDWDARIAATLAKAESIAD
jgi:aminoglycoside phosphotransferase (APT) family kinase protein